MKIHNYSKDKLIAEDVVKPRGLIRQSIGLIGARRAKPTILKTRVRTRTFGIKFPLDILIIDKNHCLAILKANL